ncbi:MAG: type II secretion system protein [Planctomycetes bacterium]|nr:type II secretion system protein [Planctomycetota bacterium]
MGGHDRIFKVSRKGITIPEFFIILILLGMVTAMAMPRISNAKSDIKMNDLMSNLQLVRSSIVLYKVEHDGLLPGQQIKGGEVSEEDFLKAIGGSDSNGKRYLDKMPRNPFNGLCSVRTGGFDLGSATGGGWFFNTKTGRFRADDPGYHRAY